jgi:hypothetical protein
MYQVMPYFNRMQDLTATHAHEEINLLAITFATELFETQADLPAYREWFRDADLSPAYGYLKRILQVLTFLRGGDRWVLKSPQHMGQLRTVSTVFPDATVIVTHRDPVSVTASLLTMIGYAARMMRGPVDPRNIAAQWLPILQDFLDGCVRERDVLTRAMDVRFTDFMADEAGVVRDIYALAGQPYDERAQKAVSAYAQENQRARHGSVHYDLGVFGLEEAGLRTRFAEYSERFDIPADWRGQGG